VPNITATRGNLLAIAAFLRRIVLDTCSLLPYNPLWHDKAGRLSITTEYGHRAFMSEEKEQACAELFGAAPARRIEPSKAAL